MLGSKFCARYACCLKCASLSSSADHSHMNRENFVGDRPISRVPPSCFALANKSPFSQGFGSLQICSVHQKIPSGANNDFWLAGLRQDALTAGAPGVFRERPAEEVVRSEKDSSIAGKRLPGTHFQTATKFFRPSSLLNIFVVISA